MKAKLFTVFIILVCTHFGYCQSNKYHPFPVIYGDWGGYETIYPSSTGGGQTQAFKYIYYTSGDTVINTLRYKKVNYINDGLFMGVLTPLNQIFTGGVYQFSYRNDSLNKKVFIVPLDSLHETLWYNFNLMVGDTLKNTYSTNEKMGTGLKVTSIDSVLICSNYYKRFSITCEYTSPVSGYYLIESVGFTSNFINVSLSDNCIFEPIHVYSTNSWSLDNCPQGLGLKNNSISGTIFKIYPNPSNNTFCIELNTPDKQTLQVYDISGKQVLAQSIEGKTMIDASNWAAGVYNLSLINSDGVINKKLVIVR